MDIAYCQLFQTPVLAAISAEGRFFLGLEQAGSAGSQLCVVSTSLEAGSRPLIPTIIEKARFGFNAKKFPSGWILELPPYFVVVVMSCVAATPWIRQLHLRFSLRSLLIATTLVAILLGLAVHFSTRPPAAPPVDHIDAPDF